MHSDAHADSHCASSHVNHAKEPEQRDFRAEVERSLQGQYRASVSAPDLQGQTAIRMHKLVGPWRPAEQQAERDCDALQDAYERGGVTAMHDERTAMRYGGKPREEARPEPESPEPPWALTGVDDEPDL